MSPYPPTPGPPLPLAERLDELRGSLERLGERLRAGIASAVTATVAEALRDTLLTLLDAPRDCREDHRQDFRQLARPTNQRQRPTWGESDYGYPQEEEELRGLGYEEEPAYRPEPQSPSRPRPRWLAALAAGWQAARWWLRRRPGRFPLLSALVVGAAAGLATLAGGPLAAAAVGLVGTALGLLSLADAARSGADALARP